MSMPSSGQHLNSGGRDDADVSGPFPIRLDKRTHERTEILGNGGMNSEQNDAGFLQRGSVLNGNLPEILIERQHDARFGFGQV